MSTIPPNGNSNSDSKREDQWAVRFRRMAEQQRNGNDTEPSDVRSPEWAAWCRRIIERRFGPGIKNPAEVMAALEDGHAAFMQALSEQPPSAERDHLLARLPLVLTDMRRKLQGLSECRELEKMAARPTRSPRTGRA